MMTGSWPEDVWQSVAQAVPEVKSGKRLRLIVESLFLVMQDTKLDVAHNPEGKYPRNSLQATVRHWHQEQTLHRLIEVFEPLGFTKEWPVVLKSDGPNIGQVGLRDLIVRTLLEVRNLPIPKERPILIARSEESWQRIFKALPELDDTERSRYVLSNLDAFMVNPDCRWADLDQGNRINTAINDWERRGLLATVVRQLTYQGETSAWVDAVPGDKSTRRPSIRHKIVQHLKKARKLLAARERREQQTGSKKTLTWKSTVKSTPDRRPERSVKEAMAHAIVNQTPLPERRSSPVTPQLTAAEIEVLQARRALRKSKANSSLPVSRREKERLKGMQRPTR